MKAIFAVLALFMFRLGDARNGKEILLKLYDHSGKCRESFGSNWIPLPDGLKCGAVDCKFPKEWCAIRSKNGVPDLYCEPLDPACQEALKDGGKEAPNVRLITSSSDNSEEETKPVTKATKPTTTTTAPSDGGSDSEAVSSAKNVIPCEDFHDVCCFWAARGECDRNANWMKRTCRKSCGVCSCPRMRANNVDLCPARVTIDGCRWLEQPGRPIPLPPVVPDGPKARVVLPLSSGAPGSPPAPPTIAVRQGAGGRAGSASSGGGIAGGVSGVIGGGNPNCQDTQPLCRLWASSGQCGINRIFMAVNCPVSCGLC